MEPRDIRDVLYASAMSYAFGPWKERVYAPFVQQLTANGKALKEVIVALMRKLVSIAQAVLQHQRPFDIANCFIFSYGIEVKLAHLRSIRLCSV